MSFPTPPSAPTRTFAVASAGRCAGLADGRGILYAWWFGDITAGPWRPELLIWSWSFYTKNSYNIIEMKSTLFHSLYIVASIQCNLLRSVLSEIFASYPFLEISSINIVLLHYLLGIIYNTFSICRACLFVALLRFPNLSLSMFIIFFVILYIFL